MERIVRREQDYEFAKKGNKHQFDFNEKVAGILEDALALIPSAPAVPAVTAGPSSSGRPSTSSEVKLRNLLQQGIKLVDEQQKLIKMADRPGGWCRSTSQMSWLRTVRMRDEFIRLRKQPRRNKTRISQKGEQREGSM